jgi:hypothetical protein
MLLRRDQGRASRRRARSKAAGVPTPCRIALDGGEPHARDAGDLALAHAGIDGVQQSLAEGNRVGFHAEQHLRAALFYLFSLPLSTK